MNINNSLILSSNSNKEKQVIKKASGLNNILKDSNNCFVESDSKIVINANRSE